MEFDLNSAAGQMEIPLRTEVNFGTTAALAVDESGEWHLLYAPIQTGVEYQASATYLGRATDGTWGQSVTLTPSSKGAQGLQIIVDSLGGLHAIWSDLACVAPEQQQIYYATRHPLATSGSFPTSRRQAT